MEAFVSPSVPAGTVKAPPSKSAAHRAVICACLAGGVSRIAGIAPSKDILATIEAMRALGASLSLQGETLEVTGLGGIPRSLPQGPLTLFCNESGSTLRFLIPLAAATGREIHFTGRGRLMERPQTVYETLFAERGLPFVREGGEIRLRGPLSPGRFLLRGDVSSQFVTGLLLTLPLLAEDSELRVLPPFESRSYVELTRSVMEAFGVNVPEPEEQPDGSFLLRVPGGQAYRPADLEIEGDYSQAAFFAGLGALAGAVECTGLSENTRQGDAVFLSLLREFGCPPEQTAGGWRFAKSPLAGIEIDLGDCPDLGPVLMALAVCAQGETRMKNAGRLRFKESDRAAAMGEELVKLGGSVQIEGDTIRINGGLPRRDPGGEPVRLSAHNDHRIAMSLAVLAAAGGGPVRITEAQCVEKSYPGFWEDLAALHVSVELKDEPADPFGPGCRVLIVGLGLIGGSYARALAAQGIPVTAIDVNPDSIAYGLSEGFLAAGATREEDAVPLIREATILVLGLYPSKMEEWVAAHQKYFRPGLLLTDVSGVKRAVLGRVQEMLREDVELIGSHPMAGREVSGVRSSDSRIFVGANFIVTPTGRNTQKGIAFARELGRRLGFARISELSPEEHDRMIGYLSQLTHAIAVSLMTANDNPHLVEYTGDSFRDLTRIARINETLWYELFTLNKDLLIPEIDSFIGALSDLKEKLAREDEEGVKALFRQSTRRRALFDRPKTDAPESPEGTP